MRPMRFMQRFSWVFALAMFFCLLLCGSALADIGGDYELTPELGVSYASNTYTVTGNQPYYNIELKSGVTASLDRIVITATDDKQIWLAQFGTQGAPFEYQGTEPFLSFTNVTAATNNYALTLSDSFFKSAAKFCDMYRPKSVNFFSESAITSDDVCFDLHDAKDCAIIFDSNAVLKSNKNTPLVMEGKYDLIGPGTLACFGGVFDSGAAKGAGASGLKGSGQFSITGGTLTVYSGNALHAGSAAYAEPAFHWTGVDDTTPGGVTISGGTLRTLGGNGGTGPTGAITGTVGGDGIMITTGKLIVTGGTLDATAGNDGPGTAGVPGVGGNGLSMDRLGSHELSISGGTVRLTGRRGQALYVGDCTNATKPPCTTGKLTLGTAVNNGKIGAYSGAAQIKSAADILTEYSDSANKYLELPGDINVHIHSPSVDTTYTVTDGTLSIPLVVSGELPITFEWQESTDGTTWHGAPNAANSATYTRTGIRYSFHGARYRCIVSNRYSRVPSHVFTLAVEMGPVFTDPLANVDVNAIIGDNVPLSVTVDSDPSLRYLWVESADGLIYHPAPGVNDQSVYQLTDVQLAQSGNRYRCYASNRYGSTDSPVFTLHVANNAPVITSPAADTTVSLQTGETAAFGVVATGFAPLSYQWQESTDTRATWHDAPGTNNQADYALPNVQLSHSGNRYRCVVTNAFGSATSPLFTLVVAAPPVPPQAPRTGDTAAPIIWLAVALLAGAALALVARRRRR